MFCTKKISHGIHEGPEPWVFIKSPEAGKAVRAPQTRAGSPGTLSVTGHKAGQSVGAAGKRGRRASSRCKETSPEG